MISPMVCSEPAITEKGTYSELQVLHSAAGYYVGTLYTNEDGFPEPGSRDSGYFQTREKATAYLTMALRAIYPDEYLPDQP